MEKKLLIETMFLILNIVAMAFIGILYWYYSILEEAILIAKSDFLHLHGNPNIYGLYIAIQCILGLQLLRTIYKMR